MKVDFDRVATLLSIVEGVSKVGPQYMALSGEAMAELAKINKEILEAQQKPKPIPNKVLESNPAPSQPVVPITSEPDSPQAPAIDRRV